MQPALTDRAPLGSKLRDADPAFALAHREKRGSEIARDDLDAGDVLVCIGDEQSAELAQRREHAFDVAIE
ncbi:MAG: hypothetical protein ACXVEE_04400 [Polyangiales bacterium]